MHPKLLSLVKESRAQLSKLGCVTRSTRYEIYVQLGYERRCELAMLMVASTIPFWDYEYLTGTRLIPRNDQGNDVAVFSPESLPYVCLLCAKEYLVGNIPAAHIDLLLDLIGIRELNSSSILQEFERETGMTFDANTNSRNHLIGKYIRLIKPLSFYPWVRPYGYVENCVAAMLGMILERSDAIFPYYFYFIHQDPAYNAACQFANIKAQRRVWYRKDIVRRFWAWWIVKAVPFACDVMLNKERAQ